MHKGLIALLVVTALLASGCFSETEQVQAPAANESVTTQDTQRPSERIQAQIDASGSTPVDAEGRVPENTEKIVIEADNFSFTPQMIRLSQGDEMSIRLIGKKGVHDFRIDELGIRSDRVNSGQTTEFVLTAEKQGTYEFYSGVANDRNLGMRGTLIIE